MQPPQPPSSASSAFAAIAIVLGVFTLLSSLAGGLLTAFGTAFFAVNTRWEGDAQSVMRSGCAFAVPLVLAFGLGVGAIVLGSRRSVAHPVLALALAVLGLTLVPATFVGTWALTKANATPESFDGPSSIQYSDPDEIGRECHAGPTPTGDCTVGFSCLGGEFASSSTRQLTCQIPCGAPDYCPYRTSCGPRGVCVFDSPR
jgi:hypothetical protein